MNDLDPLVLANFRSFCLERIPGGAYPGGGPGSKVLRRSRLEDQRCAVFRPERQQPHSFFSGWINNLRYDRGSTFRPKMFMTDGGAPHLRNYSSINTTLFRWNAAYQGRSDLSKIVFVLHLQLVGYGIGHRANRTFSFFLSCSVFG